MTTSTRCEHSVMVMVMRVDVVYGIGWDPVTVENGLRVLCGIRFFDDASEIDFTVVRKIICPL